MAGAHYSTNKKARALGVEPTSYFYRSEGEGTSMLYTKIPGGKPQRTRVISPSKLPEAYETIMTLKCQFKIIPTEISTWLLPFYHYGRGLMNTFYTALVEMNDSVEIIKEKEKIEECISSFVTEPVAEELMPREEDLRVLCHIIVLAGVKTFQPAVPNHAAKWVAARTKAAYASIHSPSSGFQWDPNSFIGISEKLATLPKLKEYFYLSIFSMVSIHPELRTAVALLSGAKMTLYTLIERFISGRPTMAHVNPVVYKELDGYKKAVDELKAEYKDKFMHHKILYPEGKTLVFTQWPNLCVAAKYFEDLNGSGTMARYQVNERNVTVPGLKELVLVEAPLRCLRGLEIRRRINPEYKRAIEYLGIDLEAYNRAVDEDTLLLYPDVVGSQRG